MKVIDLQFYRTRKEIKALERKVGHLALLCDVGSVREIKICFKEWLKVSAGR